MDLWPNYSSPYSNIGNIYLELGDKELAEEYYHKALLFTLKTQSFITI
ncbi:hypothetical protein CDO51_08290 [Natranaerobius trueperi]|uniref:Uncharacterized protein n=1 Tax=Natranaerobius trueperi TaxID=759412 RepID=A0A226BWZ0_9FIRM|nr:hypothetical protein CDO51_08290 [Natranaerobius trueperi]